MRSLRILPLLAAATFTVGLALAPLPAHSTTIWMDDRSSANLISLPIDDHPDLLATTADPGDPTDCGTAVWSAWAALRLTETTVVEATVRHTEDQPPSFMGIYRSGQPDALICIGNYEQPSIWLEPGTYDILIGITDAGAGSVMHAALSAVPFPANDAPAGAQALSLPAVDAVFDTRAATSGMDEPVPCLENADATVWFHFTAPASGHVMARSDWMDAGFAVYARGPSGLPTSPSTCATGQIEAAVVPDGDYLLQVATRAGSGRIGLFSLAEAPPLAVHLDAYPDSPSVYDEVSISLWVEGVAAPPTSCSLDFGDGTTIVRTTDCGMFGAGHTYVKDGPYSVVGRVVSSDGRQGEAQLTVLVATFDAAVSSLSTPRSAYVGKPKAVSISLTATRAIPDALVRLTKSVDGRVEDVGTLRTAIPGGKRGTTLNISYAPSLSDASAGSVVLTATVELLGDVRDPRPTNNIRVSAPIKIMR